MLQLDMEVGLGLATGQGSDPQVMMRWSDDGGKTWSNEYMRSAGKQGEYKKRIIWRRLGRGRDRIFEFVVSDPIAFSIIDGWITTRLGNS